MEQTKNPSFPVTLAEARRALKRMRAAPRPLERPLLVLGGYLELGLSQAFLKWRLRRLTGDDRIVGVSFTLCSSFRRMPSQGDRSSGEQISRSAIRCGRPRWTLSACPWAAS